MNLHPHPSRPPSINDLLAHESAAELVALFGRDPAREALRAEAAREAGRVVACGGPALDAQGIVAAARLRLEADHAPSLRPVINLTGTVLHTNLGRAPLPQEAIEAVRRVSIGASNLEYDLASGKRGDRDSHVEDWLVRLTGAEAATVVNNNAAAVLLVLNTLARRREVIVSRGELVEIGSSFRLPDIMEAAGARLREVGTTNRTRAYDYEEAIGPRASTLMRVHPSNFRIEGFRESAQDSEIAQIAVRRDLPFVIDLGAGSLVDLRAFGLPHEPTPREAIAAGAAVVTFSGDKLLGGPQAGLIVGRKDLIARIKRNPLKRALRCDKMTIAALAAILPLHAAPDRLAERLPTLRLLTRDRASIEEMARRLVEPLAAALRSVADVEVVSCDSQIGSGALPTDVLPSAGLRLSPQRGGFSETRLAALLRALPEPIIGRIEKGSVVLDLRCLEDESAMSLQFAALRELAEGARR